MRIAIIGAGGCAREIAWTVRESGFEVVGYAITDPRKVGATDHLSAPRFELRDLPPVDGFVMGIGSPSVRRRVFAEIRASHPSVAWPSIIHPGAKVGPDCAISPGVVICANASVTVNVSIGPDSLIHYNCTLSHESVTGRNVVLNPGASLSGGVTLGDDVLIGSGAHVLQYLTVGGGATIGAGAVVTRDIPAGVTAKGVPAR